MLRVSVCPVGNTSRRERKQASRRRAQFLCRGHPSGRPQILLGVALRCSQPWRFAFILTLDYGILADPGAPQRKPPKERLEEHEIQFLAEANLTPRHGARFSHAGRQRFPGAPFSRDAAPPLRQGLRATSAFGGPPVLHQAVVKNVRTGPHDPLVLGLHSVPWAGQAVPKETFASSHKLEANGESLPLQHLAPAHTDTDIYIHFQKANVIHMGDTFFNGMYPYIDSSTGGTITGMIAAADKILPLAGNYTQIVPGHGPLGNKADLAKFRDILVTARDRVQKLKSAGKSASHTDAGKPPADPHAAW